MRKLSLLLLAGILFVGSVIAQTVTRYDLENHYILPSYVEYLKTRTTPPMFDTANQVMIYRDGVEAYSPVSSLAPLFDFGAGRIAAMDSAGIDVAIISSTMCFSELDSADAVRWCREANDSVMAAVNRNPTRFRGAMVVPLQYVKAALAEIGRFSFQKVNGERIFTYWQLQSNLGVGHTPLYDQKFDTVYALASQRQMAIYLHPNTPTAPYLCDNGISYAQPGLGYGQDVMKTLVRMVASGLFDRIPQLRVVVGHYGEFLPYMVDRMDRMLNRAIAMGDPTMTCQHDFKWYVRHRNIMFTTSGNLDPRVYEAVKAEFGAECMVFASDYPYEDYNASVAVIDSMSLDSAEAADFWQNTYCNYIKKTNIWGNDTLPAVDITPGAKQTPSVQGYDFEHHCYIPAFYDTLANRTVAPYYTPDDYFLYLHTNLYSPIGYLPLTEFGQQRVDTMNAVGVQVAVMSSSEGICDLPESQAIPLARATNDSIYQMGIKYPGRFRGEMCLPVQNVDTALAEMRRCAKMGFRVWCAASNFGTSDTTATFLYEPQYEPLLAEAESLHIAIYLHPQLAVDPDFQDFGYGYASAMLGFGEDVMRCVVRLILNGTFDRYPNLRLIVPHLGEYFPFVMERLGTRFSAFAAFTGDPTPQNQHDFSYYFQNHNILISTSGMMSKVAFDLAKEVVGVDGIVFGSDYPYEDYQQQVDILCRMDLTQAELDKIWGGNAEKYIFYDIPSDVEEVTSEDEQNAVKVIKFFKDGVMYIQRGDEIYDMLGRKVK